MTFGQALNVMNQYNAAEKTRHAMNAAIDATLVDELEKVAAYALADVNELVEEARAVIAGTHTEEN